MKEKKEIRTFNPKGEYHGYQEHYFIGILQVRCIGKNGQQIGYEEWHGNGKQTSYYIR